MCLCSGAKGQFYLRGVVHDEKGKGLYNVKIQLFSKGGYPYYTGNTGAFGIPVNRAIDTITLQQQGYETLKCPVESARFQSLTMKMLPATANAYRHKLASVTKDRLDKFQSIINYHGGESYLSLVENNFVEADKSPQTGFSMNVDRASYANIRRFLNIDSKVPPDAVRIGEMLNYFDFPNSNSSTGEFTFKTQLTSCPWNAHNELLFANIQAPSLPVADVPPTNLIFLVDVSGSMDDANRLPLLKAAFKKLVNNLRAQDRVGIVVYGGGVGVWLQPTPGSDKATICNAIDRLEAGGETPGAAAITTAYGLAENVFNPHANNRVILATDGDFNVGQNSEKELEDLVSGHRKSGIYLTCIGVGMGNYKDSKLEALAKMGNGNFAYVDNMHEAEKVLIEEFSKTLYAVATDCFATVGFDTSMVKRYRLIGFENKTDAIADTASILEGGEIGNGHSLMAVFEIEPTEKNTGLIADKIKGNKLATLHLQYRLPGQEGERRQVFIAENDFKELAMADSSVRVATGIVMFGELLRQSEFAKSYTWTDVGLVCKDAIDPHDYSQAEFLTLLEKARKIYAATTKKKKRDE